MRRLLITLLALALTLTAFAPTVLAEPMEHIPAVGCDVALPEDWSLTTSQQTTVLATPIGADPLQDAESAKAYVLIMDAGASGAKQMLPMMMNRASVTEAAAELVGRSKLKAGKIAGIYDLMSEDCPIKGYVVTGQRASGHTIIGTFYFPTPKDALGIIIFQLIADGTQDLAWFFDGVMTTFPEFEDVRQSVQNAVQEAQATPLIAQMEPETDAVVEMTDAELNATLENAAQATIEQMNRAFAADPARAYWALAAEAVPLKPLFAHYEALGLTKPKASKGALSFTVPKDFQEQWGAQKTVKVAVEGINTKALTAPAASVPAMVEALEEQSIAEKELTQRFRDNPAQAYWDLAAENVALAPVLKWLEPFGLTKAKGEKAKDGTTKIAFTIPKASQEQWYGAKTMSYTLTLTDAKALSAPPETVAKLVDFCTQTWAPPTQFEFARTSAGTVTLTGTKKGLEGEITIPERYGPFPVTAIGESAFSGNEAITSVRIPGSVTQVGNQAFYQCKNLTRVTFEEGLTLLPRNAFVECENLESVVLPDSLLVIGQWAFQNCPGLTELTIPDAVVSIGDGAFYQCGLKSVSIPEGVESIGDSAFDRYELRGEYNVSVSAVMLVREGSYAQRYAQEHSKPYATIDYAVEAGEATVTGVQCNLFDAVDPVLVIPKEMDGCPVTAIGERAFAGKMNVSVVIPEGVTRIGAGAFADCSGVGVTIPNSVTQIAPDAFGGEGYTLTYEPDGYAAQFVAQHAVSTLLTDASGEWKYLLTDQGAKLVKDPARRFTGEVSIPEMLDGHPVTAIGPGMFAGNYDLTQVIIPDGVTELGAGAFEGCYLMTDVTIPAGVTVIQDRAFAECGELKNIVIPQGVTRIGAEAFRECYGLETLTIPSSVTHIADRAFARCGGLTEIMIAEGVIELGEAAFMGCYAAARIVIPASVTRIGRWAFADCNEENIEASPGSAAENYIKNVMPSEPQSGEWLIGRVAEMVTDPMPGAPKGAKGAIVMELPERAPDGEAWAEVTIYASGSGDTFLRSANNCMYVDASALEDVRAVWDIHAAWEQGEYEPVKVAAAVEYYYCVAHWRNARGEQETLFFHLYPDGTVSCSDVPEQVMTQARMRFVPLDGTPEDEAFGRF